MNTYEHYYAFIHSFSKLFEHLLCALCGVLRNLSKQNLPKQNFDCSLNKHGHNY